MKFFLVFITLMGFGRAMANEEVNKAFEGTLKENACQKLAATLTPEQKAALKTKMVAYQHKSIDFKAIMKHAVLNYKSAIIAGNQEGATSQGDLMASTKSQMVSSKYELITDTILNVLTEDQREPALCCLKHMMKKMHRRHGGRSGHKEMDTPQISDDV